MDFKRIIPVICLTVLIAGCQVHTMPQQHGKELPSDEINHEQEKIELVEVRFSTQLDTGVKYNE